MRVNSFGEAAGISYGQANIIASYKGYTTEIAAKIMAPGLGPQMTSPPEASGKVGSQFSYQITARPNPTSPDISSYVGFSVS